MPAPKNASDLIPLLERSRLLDAQSLRQVRERLTKTDKKPPEIMAELVKDGTVTKFQADQLLAGRHKGFFVGKYKILNLIGSGGMGRVYLAEHTIMRRQVALKVLPKTKGEDKSAILRFQREARAVAALNHPNIVQAYDIDEDAGLHYIVMEFVAGYSVQEIIRNDGPIGWEKATEYICQSCAGLQHAHEAGLVHRDIKPGNLLVDSQGSVKLLDLGLAVFFEEKDKDSITRAFDENVLGTADYLAPEQALDSHNVDIRADIYSLAGTYYFMLTGQPPFPDGTIAQKLLWHQSKDPRPIKELVPDLPDPLVEVFNRMMSKKAADRYQTPQDVIEALRPHLPNFGSRGDDSSFDDVPVARPSAGVATASADDEGGSYAWSASERPAASTGVADPAHAKTEADVQTLFSSDAEEGSADQLLEAISDDSMKLRGGSQSGRSVDQIANAPSNSGLSGSPSTLRPMDASDTESSALAMPATPMWKRPIVLIGSGVALVLALVVVGVFFLLPSGSTEPDQPVVTDATKDDPSGKPKVEPSEVLVAASDKIQELPWLIADITKPNTLIRLQGGGNMDDQLQLTREFAENIKGLTITSAGSPVTLGCRSGFGSKNPVVVINNAEDVTLENVILDGGGIEGPVLEVKGSVQGLRIRNVTIRNFAGTAIRISSARGRPNNLAILENITIEANGDEAKGIVFSGSGAAPTEYLTIKNSSIDNNYRFGVVVGQKVRDVVFDDITFDQRNRNLMGRIGIHLTAGGTDWSKVTIRNCYFKNMEYDIRASSAATGTDAIVQKENSSFGVSVPTAR
ncbi:Serine/threonine-protein kinase PknB [Planctomycetes bacterium Pan216]|uniref:Serine/threonine-protein kinase PknB n=1 Tax=Kolteria novifilia TaxID=2527975 RepID=A0A518AYQ8_9BACT|nr:Serine/threonine-protein kinase PknB [Planctomycetes bacterium Pan216]